VQKSNDLSDVKEIKTKFCFVKNIE